MDDEDALQLVKETLAQVEAALANLRQGLLEARDMPNDLARSGYALTAACNFVDAFEDFRRERLSEPLHMLNAAVFDLSEGARPALLVPVKTYNRPRDSTDKRDRRLFAAVVMEAYMQVGLGRKEAAKRAGRFFDCPHSSVAHWRERLMRASEGTPLDMSYSQAFHRHRTISIKHRVSSVAWRSPQDVDDFARRLAARFREKPPS